LKPAYQNEVAAIAHRRGIALHLDGARLFNAAVALGVSPVELALPFDSVTFCFSKGLAAPVGSVICGSREFIKEARRIRKQVGGGMRQAGVLAAAGLLALRDMVARLAEDHAHARLLATGLAAVPGLAVEVDRVETNIVYVDLVDKTKSPPEFLEAMKSRGVLFFFTSPRRFRLLTHYGLEAEDIMTAVAAFREVMK
jgi:threonine aldolase